MLSVIKVSNDEVNVCTSSVYRLVFRQFFFSGGLVRSDEFSTVTKFKDSPTCSASFVSFAVFGMARTTFRVYIHTH